MYKTAAPSNACGPEAARGKAVTVPVASSGHSNAGPGPCLCPVVTAVLRACSWNTTSPNLSGLVRCGSRTRPEARPFQLHERGRPYPSDLTCATAGAGGHHLPRPRGGRSPEACPTVARPRLRRSLGYLVCAAQQLLLISQPWRAPARARTFRGDIVGSYQTQHLTSHCSLPPPQRGSPGTPFF